MSHAAVSGAQFHEQLPLFMHTDDIVDKVSKGDSFHRGKWTPREQWERPGGAEGYQGYDEASLREKKTEDLQPGGSHHDKFARQAHRPQMMPPVEIYHSYLGKTPQLTEGHHRLAWAQMHGTPYLNVEHRIPERDYLVMEQARSERRRGIRS